ncbi:MAG: RNA-binding S4 domain-containing protein [Bacteroidia bacterium]
MAKEELRKVRLDKYLWAIRVFKTRSLASAACDKGRVICNNIKLKASYSVKPGDIYHIKIDTDHTRVIEVVALSEKRESAEKMRPYFIDRSPEQVKKEKLPSVFYEPQGKRDKGTGRPTKKDGREIRKNLF